MSEFHPSFYLVGAAAILLIWGVRFVGGCLARVLQVVGVIVVLAALALFYIDSPLGLP